MVHLARENVLPMEADLTARGGFQQVDAPQQRAFTAAGSADNAGDISRVYVEIHILKHKVVSKALAQVPYL
ncbi:hypothetical protein SDC9_208058 [bioreactor metagenome]|uniref:Uncharacterized protein n=1 Tax=bioreactor metagenome TaxID=1076179 RepID=A0A645JAZ9_9ZZZZ